MNSTEYLRERYTKSKINYSVDVVLNNNNNIFYLYTVSFKANIAYGAV